MARQAEKIVGDIKDAFPTYFRGAPSVDVNDYILKRNALTDYAVSVSGSYMSAETIRYQNILLYFSLAFLSLNMLRLHTFRLFDNTISINREFNILFAAFMTVVAAVFLAKALLDYRRAQFVRMKNDHTINDLSELNAIGNLRVNIEHYFWLQVFDEIGLAYQEYSEALRNARGKPAEVRQEPIHMQSIMKIDLLAAAKIPYLREHIERCSEFVDTTKANIYRYLTRFRSGTADIRPAEVSAEPFSPDASNFWEFEEKYSQNQTNYARVEKLFADTVEPWVAARVTLSSDGAKQSLSDSADLGRSAALLHVVRRILLLRRLYFVVEIIVPVAFLVVVLVYVAFFAADRRTPQIYNLLSCIPDIYLRLCKSSISFITIPDLRIVTHELRWPQIRTRGMQWPRYPGAKQWHWLQHCR